MALELTRYGIMSGIGGYRGAAHSMVHGAGSMLRHEIKFVSHVETGLSAFTFGVIAGKFHDSKGAVLWGLPVDLVSGISLHLLALLGVARPYKHHLQSIGTGAIATYLTLTGYRVGQRWGAGGKFLASVAGAFVGEDKPVSGGSSLAGESAADVELKKLVQGEAAEG